MEETEAEGTEESIDWGLTTWEGSKREQVRRWAEIPLDRAIMAMEEMEELARHLQAPSSMMSEVAEPAGADSRRAAPGGLSLPGCRPEPLMSYLKALGILRLVSEQKDPNARGWWRNDEFRLHSPVLFQEGAGEEAWRASLVRFFLEEYEPTPIVAPWGARSGFYPGTSESSARIALETILISHDERLSRFRLCIELVRCLLRELGLDAKVGDEEKIRLLRHCRSNFPEDTLSWLDACVVLTGEDRRYPPILGTGGNEGSGSYVSGFARQVVECVLNRKHDRAMEVSLFANKARNVVSDQTPGHFSPMASGGANATQGFEAGFGTNPWDYLLCLEGACMWAGAAVRRMGSSGPGVAAFPFTFDVRGSGYTSLAFKDAKKPKQAKREIAEMWLPTWERSLSASEVSSILSEGRAFLGSRQARTALDAARAACSLGVDRGIRRFTRTVFLMRNGQSFFSIPLSTFEVTDRRQVDLLREIDEAWLEPFRRAVGDKTAPPRLASVLQRVESAIFEFCKQGGTLHFQGILTALGSAERALILTGGRVGRSKTRLNPIRLSRDWMEAADDGSHEFALARALASIHEDPKDRIGPLRANLEPVDWKKRFREWAKKDHSVVWNVADLATNLVGVLERRLMDGERTECELLPLASRFTVPLASIERFLAREIDDERIEELIWGLALVDHRLNSHAGSMRSQKGVRKVKSAAPAVGSVLPRAYALLKLLFLPRPLVIERGRDGKTLARMARKDEAGEVAVRPEPSILHLLRGGRLGEACVIAIRRLRASGLVPMPGPLRGVRVRDRDWLELDSSGAGVVDSRRIAAALPIPIGEGAIDELFHLVIRDDGENDE